MSSKAQRRGSDYRRKRKRFHNNQYTRKVSDKLDVDCISASAKKLCKESDLDKEVRNSNQSNGYRLINIDILLSELSQYVTCPNCNTKAVLKEKILYGLVSEFYVECYSCSTLSTFKSSPIIASGQRFCVFRGEGGQAYVLDAYCPHLGADMSAGGKVAGECIECPFHGWQFSGQDGACQKIPYSCKVPDVARAKKWSSCEVNAFIFVWHHAEGEEPTWTCPPSIPSARDSGSSGQDGSRGALSYTS
ncbi:3-ketosteroid-9-alpha-monooxygenase, oxygenase component [Trichonephila clavata]|uniref:3-ketosteroid-9-alpha-monooxygenase, oxygenase component n=1 Tax=Trichonephila clavata TaxID=2740835 RepID=A0A8X6H7B7_TRICU|nr:3-ketosteroid-9-alpha-monooxygenase, oxygenase component [Trichonephila clavata]